MRNIFPCGGFLVLVFCQFPATNQLYAQWMQTTRPLGAPVASMYGGTSRSTGIGARWSGTTSLFTQFKDTTNGLESSPSPNLVWAPFDESTMWVQAACGIGFAGAGAAIGYAALPKGGDASGVGTGIAVIVGVTLASIGLPLGTYLGGEWMGGNGGWWPTLGGCVAGGIVGLVPNIFIKYDDAGVTAIVFGIAAVAGGIAGYHLSASPVHGPDTYRSPDLRFGRVFPLNGLAASGDQLHIRVPVLTIRL